MEITSEIKAKVFAQYLGQLIKHSEGKEKLKVVDIEICMANFGWGNAKNIAEECQLILKPLSAITDEDAVEIAKRDKYNLYNEIEVTEIKRRKDHIEIYYRYDHPDPDLNNDDGFHYSSIAFSLDSNKLTVRQYQKVIELGYDTKQELLGGKTLKEAGLAIYENENS